VGASHLCLVNCLQAGCEDGTAEPLSAVDASSSRQAVRQSWERHEQKAPGFLTGVEGSYFTEAELLENSYGREIFAHINLQGNLKRVETWEGSIKSMKSNWQLASPV
jgi:hypothetical protein